ncbi:uncharacterized protein LY89DRAFT_702610 [Mollisia scopiformis]|uniref:Uncharacterized protein n=1 Tax=Mollisia scopiformis TaxID=149040 RepID=A0A132B5K9_MOLSC|nr:uncharacterized protein LY89DRAFT_702610 [Mollisia scopiformis]KUJ06947.1 hypothetical protein LY89DRAFT_702610 [Mollisia scopiformis]
MFTGNVSRVPSSSDVARQTHHEIYSVSTNDRKYFFVDFIDRRSINPNIIPHPSLEDTWVIVAQRHDPDSRLPMTFAEITCNATFQNGTLRCLESPSILPVITTPGDKCDGDYLVLNLNIGPHDARVFYGPDAPYTIYGSNSRFTCFGQFVHDLRSLLDWGNGGTSDTGFKNATELQRPLPYGKVEKNWFVFWDHKGEIYVHYDVSPKRAFAKLELDGSVGEDLAPQAARAGDDSCMAKYLPTVGPDHESLHQATNSLSVTLCKRSDPSCKMNEENTFILTIFQHKRYRFFHSVYEPYAMLFEQKSPFKIHGISSKPFWIHGRWKPSSLNEQDRLAEMMIKDGKVRNYNQTEMMYITSMSWKSSKQKYHGFLDDVVFLGFGIEDSQSAGIDVVVGDLLTGMSLC